VCQTNFHYNNFFFHYNNFFEKTESTFTNTNDNFFEKTIFLTNNLNFHENNLPELIFNFNNEKKPFENYLNLRKFSFTTFFTSNLIDVPICFKKIKSIKTKNFELFFLKFSNIIMREGKKEKILRIILNSFFNFLKFKKESIILKSNTMQ
jgi:hypothetical protein